MIIINGERLDDGVDEPERCPVCGDYEPCSHNFDEMGEQLEAIGRKMGTEARTPNAEVSHAAPPAASDKPTAQRGGVALH